MSFVANPGRTPGLRLEPVVDRTLQCIAGFYGSRAQAQAAVRQLQNEHCLQPSHLLMLGPKDASAARFAWQARRWAKRCPIARRQQFGDIGLSALFGAVLASGLALLWLVLELGAPEDMAADWWLPVAWLVTAVVVGADIGAATVALLDQGDSPKAFDRIVQRQLAARKWAVVAHSMPDGSQAGVIGLLQASDRHWSAAAKPLQRL